MRTKTILMVLGLLALLLAACGGAAANNAANTNQGSVVVENSGTAAGENQTGDQAAVSPTEKPAEDAKQDVSFANDVLPILESRCLTCHGGDRTEANLTLGSYASLMAGSKSGAVILPGDAAGSLLYQLVAEGEMPKRGAKLTPVQLETLLEWINAGALDN